MSISLVTLKKQFTKCCDVFEKHKKNEKGGHVLNLDMAMDLKNKNGVVPGWQLYHACYKEIMKENKSKAEDDNSAKSDNDDILNIDLEMERNAKKTNLNDSLGLIGISGNRKQNQSSVWKAWSFEVQKGIFAVFFWCWKERAILPSSYVTMKLYVNQRTIVTPYERKVTR